MNRRLRPLWLVLIGWLAITSFSFRGCTGLFTPERPEAPTGPIVIPNYRTPNLTLKTMEDALASKALGNTAWMGAFADSTGPTTPGYHHIFDPVDVDVFEAACGCEAPADWGSSQEQQFYLAFLNVRPSDNYTASFDSIPDFPDPPEGENEARLTRSYRVIATSPDESSTLIIATGYADLTFRKVVGDNWVITRWEDHIDPAVGPYPVDEYQISMGRLRLQASR